MATYTIGRSDENDIVLSDTTVSRQHAELETGKRGRYTLRDLDSTYGTRIYRDGEWLDIIEVEVTDDTEVTFGEYRSTIGEVVALAAATPATVAPESAAAPADAPATPEPAPAPQAPPEPAPPSRSATPAPGGAGMDRRMTLLILAGGGALLVLVVIVVVLALTTGGSDTTPNRAALSTPTTATRASFEAALVKSCSSRHHYNDTQCHCIARQMSDALTREELAIYVALRHMGKDADKVHEIMERFGAAKVAAIGVKMVAVIGQVRQKCGVTLKR